MTAGMLGHEVAIATSILDGQTGRSEMKNLRNVQAPRLPCGPGLNKKRECVRLRKQIMTVKYLDVIRLWEGGQIKVLGNLCHNGHVVANACLQPNACNQRAVKQS